MAQLQVNAVIFGAGAAGLWTLDAVRRSGRSAILFEATAHGGRPDEFLARIIHSGLKYSCTALLTSAAKEARDGPSKLGSNVLPEGRSGPFGVKILSPACLPLGPTRPPRRSACSAHGSYSARRRRMCLRPNAPRRLAQCSGAVYRIDEEVLSPESLLRIWPHQTVTAIFHYDAAASIAFRPIGPRRCARRYRHVSRRPRKTDRRRRLLRLHRRQREPPSSVLAPVFPSEKMQRRPLHDALARGPLPEFYGHCIEGRKRGSPLPLGRDVEGRTVCRSPATWLRKREHRSRRAHSRRRSKTSPKRCRPSISAGPNGRRSASIAPKARRSPALGPTHSSCLPTASADSRGRRSWMVPKLADELAKFVAQTEPRPLRSRVETPRGRIPAAAPPHWDRPQTGHLSPRHKEGRAAMEIASARKKPASGQPTRLRTFQDRRNQKIKYPQPYDLPDTRPSNDC